MERRRGWRQRGTQRTRNEAAMTNEEYQTNRIGRSEPKTLESDPCIGGLWVVEI